MSDPGRNPTWQEGTERLLAKLPHLLAEGEITINDARVIQYLAGLLPAMSAEPPPPESMLHGAQWVKVEFYGLVPYGQVITGLDPLEVGGNLMRAFGFTHIDGLTVVAEPPLEQPR